MDPMASASWVFWNKSLSHTFPHSPFTPAPTWCSDAEVDSFGKSEINRCTQPSTQFRTYTSCWHRAHTLHESRLHKFHQISLSIAFPNSLCKLPSLSTGTCMSQQCLDLRWSPPSIPAPHAAVSLRSDWRATAMLGVDESPLIHLRQTDQSVRTIPITCYNMPFTSIAHVIHTIWDDLGIHGV